MYVQYLSKPAQPSFVWQLYHYDMEPNASLFAVRSAGEMVHIQFNESNGELQVINNLPDEFNGGTAHVTIYNFDGNSGLRNPLWAKPRGVQISLNGKPVAGIPPDDASHTFAIPDMGISVPIHGVADNAPNQCATPAPWRSATTA